MKPLNLSDFLAGADGIFESYDRCIDKATDFRDAVEKLKNMTAEEYGNTILELTNRASDKKFVGLVQAAAEKWKELGGNPVDVPFALEFVGTAVHIKLRRAVADALGITDSDLKDLTGVKVGNGTLKLGETISTSSQERATCILWNRMASLDLLDKATPDEVKATIENELLDDKGEKVSVPADWVTSCIKQCMAIRQYLDRKGKKPNDYVASRFNEGSNSGDFARIYKQMVDAYKSKFTEDLENPPLGNSKDTYDPSDIILIHKGAEERLKQIIKLPTYPEIYKAYMELFLSTEVLGISLKKITGSPKYEVFNISEDIRLRTTKAVSELYLNKDKKEYGGVRIHCKGNYNLRNMSDPEDTDRPEGNESEIVITARSFDGGRTLGFEIKDKTGPSLGKVPVDTFKSLLELKDTKFTQDMLKYIQKALNRNPKMANELIQAGMKCGPWCLPFLLVH